MAVNSSPQRRAKFLALQKGRELYAVCPILDVQTRWNSTLVMLQRAYRLKSYTAQWLQNLEPKDHHLRVLHTTPQEWVALEYLMTILEPMQYWTLAMSKRRDITLHLVITLYNDMFNHFDRVISTLSHKRAEWKQDLKNATAAASSKLSAYYSDVTPESGLLMILAVILDPFTRLSIFRKWDRATRNDLEPTSYESTYRKVFMEYYDLHYVPVAEEEPDSPTVAEDSVPGDSNSQGFWKPPGNDSDSESDNEVYSTMTGTQSYGTPFPHSMSPSAFSPLAFSLPSTPNHARQISLAAALRYLDEKPTEVPYTVVNALPAEEDITEPERMTKDFFRPDVLGWWREVERTEPSLKDLAAMARDVFSTVPHSVGVESSFSIARKAVGWQQSAISAGQLENYVIYRQGLRSEIDITPAQDARKRVEAVANIRDHGFFVQEAKQAKARRAAARARRGVTAKERISRSGFISDDESDESSKWDTFDHDGPRHLDAEIRSGVLASSLPESNPLIATQTPLDIYMRSGIRPLRRAAAQVDESDSDWTDTEDLVEDEEAEDAVYADPAVKESDSISAAFVEYMETASSVPPEIIGATIVDAVNNGIRPRVPPIPSVITLRPGCSFNGRTTRSSARAPSLAAVSPAKMRKTSAMQGNMVCTTLLYL